MMKGVLEGLEGPGSECGFGEVQVSACWNLVSVEV